MKGYRLLTIGAVLVTSALPSLAEVPVRVCAPEEAIVGEPVIVRITSLPKAKAKIEARQDGMTQSLKLMDRDTDTNGQASWKFDIPQNYSADRMPLTITVTRNGEEGKSTQAIKVLKEF
jgi:hypothetical protein